jgi:hypothetical protein
MSDSDVSRFDEFMERGQVVLFRIEKKEKMLNKLFWTLLVSIVAMVVSISTLTLSDVSQRKDIEYVRQHAYNREAALDSQATYEAVIDGLGKLVKDDKDKKIVDEFNAALKPIIARINSRESEIVPRGTKETGKGGSGGSK